MSDFTHHRARLAALQRHGADEAMVGAARRDLAAARLGRAWAGECARLGQPEPPPELQVTVAAALLATGGPVAA